MKRALVLAGNYGSGKTELSLNMAREFAKKGNTVLVDMDIVNPYFRSAEHESMLKDCDIGLIAPTFANTAVDVPVISADVKNAFNYEYAVFDSGGDPVGAAVFGSIVKYFDEKITDFWYVVNARRPLQRDAGEIIGMMEQIAARARLKMTGIVNNTNLARETSPEDLLFGLDICREVSRKSGLPLVFSSGTTETVRGFREKRPEDDVFEMDIFTRPYWLDITAE